MANLQLESLSKIYPSGALALYKTNLELPGGEFIAVIGGEKSGKSTLLRIVAGLEEATEGKIIVGGKDVTKTDSKDRDVAMIFQGNTLYPSLTVADNIAYGLKIRKVPEAVVTQRVKVAAEVLGLGDILMRKPKALTAEQKQLTAFARAIVREPKLYLLDDPLSGLSPETRVKLRSVLVNLQMRVKGTFLYATKNVNDAIAMASRMLVLREGFVQQIDTPSNLYEYPVNAYVAMIVGSPACNFVNGAAIVREEDKLYAEAFGVKFPIPENIAVRFEKAEEYVNTGKKVIIGIRPEDLTIGENGFFRAKVTNAQRINSIPFADLEGDKLSMVVKAECEKGDEAEVCGDLSHMFIFDSETRLTLLARDDGYKKTELPGCDFVPATYAEEEEIKNKLKLKPADKKKK